MWKLRIGALVTSGVFALALSSTAWATTSGGGRTTAGSVNLPAVITTTSIGGVTTSIGSVEIRRAKANEAHKRHRRVRRTRRHKIHTRHVKAVTMHVSTFTG